MLDDPRAGDPRDNERDSRDIDIRWVSLDHDPSDAHDIDARGREPGERDRDRDPHDRHDPRDAFVHDLELPRDRDRELVIDRDRLYELDGEGTRTLAAAGAFCVVSERDLPADERTTVKDLGQQGLLRYVAMDERERAATLTERGRRFLESHRRERDDRRYRQGDRRRQAFHSGINNPRELKHDATLYRAYLRAEERLRERGADVRRVVLEGELKREYQQFLQERNRDRPDSDGRPGRDRGEIEAWAREHELPCVDGSVQFPDFRIEYEVHGREEHEDVEVVTANYRGAHAASRASSGFTCYSESGGRGVPFDPDLASRFV